MWSCRVRPGGLLHLSSPAASLSSFDPTEARAAPGGSFPHLPASALTLPHFPVEWGRVPTPRSALLFSPPAFTEASATSPKHHRLTRVLPQPPLSLPPRSLDEHGLQFMRELPAPRPVLTSPCFSLRCLASAVWPPPAPLHRRNPHPASRSSRPSMGYVLLYRSFCLQTSFSPRLGREDSS